MAYERRTKKIWVTITESEHEALANNHIDAGYRSMNDWIHAMVRREVRKLKKK